MEDCDTDPTYGRHYRGCSHRKQRLEELRAAKAARESKKCLDADARHGTGPALGKGMVAPGFAEQRGSESSSDTLPSGCPPEPSSTKRVRKSGTTCLATATPTSTISSMRTTIRAPQSCEGLLELSCPPSISTSGTRPDGPPTPPPTQEEARSMSAFARRNRYLPLALRSASNWKPTMPRHGSGDASASLARMISDKPIPIRQTTTGAQATGWSGS